MCLQLGFIRKNPSLTTQKQGVFKPGLSSVLQAWLACLFSLLSYPQLRLSFSLPSPYIFLNPLTMVPLQILEHASCLEKKKRVM
jgi:hypothetical protein